MPVKFGPFSVSVVAIVGAFILTACGSNSGGSGGGGNKPTVGGLAVYPGSATIPETVNGGQPSIAQFTAYAGAAVTSATWSVVSGTGTITAGGVFTAPGVPETDTIQAVSGSNASAPITVNVVASQPVAVSPAAAAVPAGATLQFTTAAGCAGTIWQANLNGNSGSPGLITNGPNCGLYTAPLTPPASGTVTISATSGGNTGTSTVTILFSNASFNSLVNEANPRPYAFSYSGDDSSGFLAVAGTFVADGNGNITGGTEDINSGFAAPTMSTFGAGSTYTVGPDGRTTANLNVGGSMDVLQFALISNQHALMIRFDTAATGSGTIDMQDPTQFSSPFSLGAYVFSVSGLDKKGAPVGIDGRLTTNGNAFPLNGGTLDLNDGGTSVTDSLVQGGFLNADPATGRGTLTLNCPTFDTDFGDNGNSSGSLTFIYYIVDGTHLKVLEGDSSALLAGDFYSASSSTTNMGTAQAFVVGGSDNNGSPYGMGGAFVMRGGGVLDINDDGDLTSPTTSPSNITTPNITSANAALSTTGNGRISLSITLTDGTLFQFAAYLFNYTAADGSPSTGAVLLETDTHFAVGSGVAYTQTGSTTPQGSFALNLTGAGTDINSIGGQDIAGRIVAGNSGSLTGALDINDDANSGKLFSGQSLSSPSTIPATSSNGRGNPLVLAEKFQTNTLSYYVIDDSTALLLEMDGSRVMTGKMARQF